MSKTIYRIVALVAVLLHLTGCTAQVVATPPVVVDDAATPPVVVDDAGIDAAPSVCTDWKPCTKQTAVDAGADATPADVDAGEDATPADVDAGPTACGPLGVNEPANSGYLVFSCITQLPAGTEAALTTIWIADGMAPGELAYGASCNGIGTCCACANAWPAGL